MREIINYIINYLEENKISITESVVIPYYSKYDYAEKITTIQGKKVKIIVLHNIITVKILGE